MFGWTAEEAVGRHVGMITPEERYAEREQWFARALQGETVGPLETMRRRKDGAQIPTEVTITPILDELGRVAAISATLRDVTERRLAEQRHQLLINELNHRVKNVLASVQSLAAQTLRTSPPQQAQAALESRPMALSRAHEVLTRENWERAMLSDILAEVLEPYRHRGPGRLTMYGPPVHLSPRMAVGIAMAVQELATNALKYGAFSNETGRVEVSWARDEAGRGIELQWLERDGPPVTAPQRAGFGTRLVTAGLKHLGGEVRMDYEPAGLRWRLRVPLPFPGEAGAT